MAGSRSNQKTTEVQLPFQRPGSATESRRLAFEGKERQEQGRFRYRLLTNLRSLKTSQTNRYEAEVSNFPDAESFWAGVRFFVRAFQYDLVLINGDINMLLGFCLCRRLFPFQRCRVVSSDLVLNPAKSFRGRMAIAVKRWLMRRVELFLLYFKDLGEYDRSYGITAARARYVPFKVNLPERLPWADAELKTDGDYIFCCGRSKRDIKTFVEAARRTGYPAILRIRNPNELTFHGTELELKEIPANLTIVDDEECPINWIDQLHHAKMLVQPIVPNPVSPAGISTYLVAMALRKCVVITEGPATVDLLSEDEAVIVPPADPEALAQAMHRVWSDDDFRNQTAEAGKRYADGVGRTERLYRDFVNICGGLLAARLT